MGTAARQRAGRSSLASRKALPESQNGRKTCLKSLPAEEDFTVIWAAIATGLLVSSQNLYKRQGHMCTHTHMHMLTQHKNSRKSQPCERKGLSGITSWAYLRYLPRPRNFRYSVPSGEHGQVAVQNPGCPEAPSWFVISLHCCTMETRNPSLTNIYRLSNHNGSSRQGHKSP